MNRTERQDQIVRRIQALNFRCYIEAATGFGKSIVAIKAAKLADKPVVHVIVPRISIKQSWEKYKDIIPFETYVVNSYFNKREAEPDVIIADEIHRYSNEDAKVFSKIITEHNSSYIIGLSATLDNDKRKFLKRHGILRADYVPIEECLEKGYISQFRFINVGIKLPHERHVLYNHIDRKLNGVRKILASMLGYRGIYSNMRTLMNTQDRNHQNVVNRAYEAGVVNVKTNRRFERNEIVSLAFAMNSLYAKRSEFIHLSEEKINVASQIIRETNRKTVTFSQRIDTIDELAKSTGYPYHSKTKKSDKDKYMDLFMNDSKGVLHSGSSIKEGFDCEDITQGIQLSRTSKKLDLEQYLGRVVRIFEDETSFFWNLYLLDTQDQVWVENSTAGIPVVENLKVKMNETSFLSNFIARSNS